MRSESLAQRGCMRRHIGILAILVAVAAANLFACRSAMAQQAVWTVAKSSGEVVVAAGGNGAEAAVSQGMELKPGDALRTGRNGRVLLTRGEERITVSPNTAIGIPAEKKDGLNTTITQRSGTIVLEVEKRNVQHFEVETPYLAAVVKGTQFRVSVQNGRSKVDVLRGQVQVSDFKSGQRVLLVPGQSAGTMSSGAGGLRLSGSGQFNPIERGAPRMSSVRPAGSTAVGARSAPASLAPGSQARAQHAATTPGERSGLVRTSHGGLRIGAALGEVKIDFHKATKGLAHGPAAPNGARDSHRGRGGADDALARAAATPQGLGGNTGLGDRGNGGAAASYGATGSGNGSGGGNGGGNSNAGGNGVGNAYGVDNGGGNGNGNNGNGNAYAYGHGKKNK